uniref:Serine/threonine-protein phosphatase 6 regulatory subunit 2-like n=1 Tax=Sinocyclocheilus rhinocerous TaxID=307959 RepID=A0A673KRT6_9TELE
MFWKFDLHNSSQIEKLLEKEDVTLQELLDEEDVLQECKAQNQRLLLFLTRDSSMLELLNLITHEPPADREEKLRYKYANVACELLTCDMSLINDKVGGDESLMNTLYSFLEQKSALNPLLASFFSKAFGNLITRKTEQVIGFLKNKEDFVGQVLKHLDTSAMMDLVLRVISSVEPVCLRQEVLTWLNEERLIQRLVELIHPHSDSETQSNASQTLCDIIRLSRDQAMCVCALLKNMFEGEKSEVCIVNGTQVLLTLLETRRPGVEQVIDLCSQGLEKSYTVNNSILMGIQPHLKHFHHLLLNPPKKCVMLTTMGVLEEPFGNARLHASRLMAALLYTRAPRIHLELCQLNMINLLLDLFFKFSWNNFLHIQVEHCVSAILNQTTPIGKTHDSPDQIQLETQDTQNSDKSDMFTCCDMMKHLLKDCRLVQRILDAWEENDKTQEAGGMRKGYMGHMTRIANTVVQNAEREQEQTQIARLIKGKLPEDYKARWEQFVNETLTETNKKNTADLVRFHTKTIVGSIFTSKITICKSPLISILLLTQVFSDYQIQQMTANFVDQFGLNDDEFGDHDGSISATFDRITEIKFNLVDEGASSAIFETRTKERIRPFDDAEEEEDIWEDKEINYATQVKARSRFIKHTHTHTHTHTHIDTQNSHCSSSLDDSHPSGPGWIASFEDDFSCRDFTSIVMDTGSSVWGSSTAQLSETEEKGWATFTDFQPFCCSDAGPRCSSPVDSENSNKPSQNEESKFSSACVWNVCGARKAPLVASDSSSSESDSEEEEDRTNITESVATANAKDNVKLSVDAKNEKAVFIR